MRIPPTMNRADYLQMHRERRDLVIAEVKTHRSTYAQIAKMFGISGARVSQIAATVGIKRKRGGNMRRGKPQP